MPGINNDSHLFFTLPPPGSEGLAYDNLAVDSKGVPIGDKATAVSALGRVFGYSDQDTIGSALDDVLNLASQVNIFLLDPQSISDKAITTYLQTVDPKNPTLPPNKLANVSRESLTEGNIGRYKVPSTPTIMSTPDTSTATTESESTTETSTKGVGGDKSPSTPITKTSHTSTTEADTTTEATTKTSITNTEGDKPASRRTITSPPSDTEGTAIDRAGANTSYIGSQIDDAKENNEQATINVTLNKGTGGNPWLGLLVLVAFLIEFAKMQKVLMRNKEVQGTIEVASMNLIVSLAASTSDLIKEIARKNQMIHITSAVFAAVSLTISLYSAVQAAKYTKTGGASGWDSAKVSMYSGIGSQLEKFATSIAQASSDMVIAEKEGRKEMLQAYRTIAQRQMDKAAEAFKASEDMIAQSIQTLDKIREGLNQAVAASLHK